MLAIISEATTFIINALKRLFYWALAIAVLTFKAWNIGLDIASLSRDMQMTEI